MGATTKRKYLTATGVSSTPTKEIKPMEKAIEDAIKLLAEKIKSDVKPDDALKFTQAALNLAHVSAVQRNNKNI